MAFKGKDTMFRMTFVCEGSRSPKTDDDGEEVWQLSGIYNKYTSEAGAIIYGAQYWERQAGRGKDDIYPIPELELKSTYPELVKEWEDEHGKSWKVKYPNGNLWRSDEKGSGENKSTKTKQASDGKGGSDVDKRMFDDTPQKDKQDEPKKLKLSKDSDVLDDDPFTDTSQKGTKSGRDIYDLPSDEEEQQPLVRFSKRKYVPLNLSSRPPKPHQSPTRVGRRRARPIVSDSSESDGEEQSKPSPARQIFRPGMSAPSNTSSARPSSPTRDASPARPSFPARISSLPRMAAKAGVSFLARDLSERSSSPTDEHPNPEQMAVDSSTQSEDLDLTDNELQRQIQSTQAMADNEIHRQVEDDQIMWDDEVHRQVEDPSAITDNEEDSQDRIPETQYDDEEIVNQPEAGMEDVQHTGRNEQQDGGGDEEESLDMLDINNFEISDQNPIILESQFDMRQLAHEIEEAEEAEASRIAETPIQDEEKQDNDVEMRDDHEDTTPAAGSPMKIGSSSLPASPAPTRSATVSIYDQYAHELVTTHDAGLDCLVRCAFNLQGMPCDPWVVKRKNSKQAKYLDLICTLWMMLHSWDPLVLKHLVHGDIPREEKKNRELEKKLRKLKDVGNHKFPSTYIHYLVDRHGESPTPEQLSEIMDKIREYLEGFENKDPNHPSHVLAYQIDNEVSNSFNRYPSAGAREGVRRYVEKAAHVVQYMKFIGAVEERLRFALPNVPLDRPLCEVGYATKPTERLDQHAKHTSSNYIMNLVGAICMVTPGLMKFKIRSYVVHHIIHRNHAMFDEILASRMALSYTTQGGGFNHFVAGVSHGGADKIDADHYKRLQRTMLEDLDFNERVKASLETMRRRAEFYEKYAATAVEQDRALENLTAKTMVLELCIEEAKEQEKEIDKFKKEVEEIGAFVEYGMALKEQADESI